MARLEEHFLAPLSFYPKQVLEVASWKHIVSLEEIETDLMVFPSCLQSARCLALGSLVKTSDRMSVMFHRFRSGWTPDAFPAEEEYRSICMLMHSVIWLIFACYCVQVLAGFRKTPR